MTGLTTRTSCYGQHLARIHCEAYADTFKPGFPWLAEQVKSAPGAPHMFDIGCGCGTWMAAAKDMGISSQGIDTSADFVNICTEKGLNARLDSAARPPWPQGINAVTALGEVLSYQPASLSPFAFTASRNLPKGGVFIFDLPGIKMTASAGKSEGDGWKMETRTFVSGNTLSRHIAMQFEEGRREETHFQRLFSPHEVTGILAGFGFSVEILSAYGACDMLPGRFGVLAHKL